jgi:cholesterol transport system auxiliary component
MLALLAGCIDLAKPYPERKAWVLKAERSGPPAVTATGTVLKVRRFKVSPRCDGVEFVLRRGDLHFESDFYNIFFETPAAMVTEEAKGWIAASKRFGHVVDFSSHVEATHVLEGNVVALYGDLRAAPKAVLEAQFFLIDDRVTPPAIVLSRTYAKSVDAPDGGAEALAKGWNGALAQALEAFEADLAKVKIE